MAKIDNNDGVEHQLQGREGGGILQDSNLVVKDALSRLIGTRGR